MRRGLVLIGVLGVCAAPVPAVASDAQLERVLGRTFVKIGYIAKRINPDRPKTLVKFAARLARAAKLAAHRIVRISPSTHQGAVARHRAIAALKEIRVGARAILLGLNSNDDGLLETGAKRMALGFFDLLSSSPTRSG